MVLNRQITAVVYEELIKDGRRIKLMLESLNFNAIWFHKLRGMIIGIKREKVDLLILSLTPKNWNSLMIVKHLKRDHETANIPIIIIMSDPSKDMVLIAHKLGVKNILLKPVKPDSLLAEIQKMGLDQPVTVEKN